MRLLKFDSRDELTLTKNFDEKNVPSYAILSHTWGADEDEVNFKDLENGCGRVKAGYDKLLFCGEQARRDGLQYFWVDTCCIDKANYTELSEAITSMFRWYRDSVKCYVYLSDVLGCNEETNQTKQTWKSVWGKSGRFLRRIAPVRHEDKKQTEQTWESAFRKSRWFTRGWTLQELVAPRSVEFFSWKGQYLGNKNTLERWIHEITEIPIEALRGAPLSRFSVHERMRWAENRKTQKEEDKAYCLLGIFNVFMALIYGEGENAFVRLEAEIAKSSRNHELARARERIPCLPYRDRHRDLQLRRMEGVGQWILKTPQFISWRDGSANSATLWCNGQPGAGKTYLASVIIDHLEDRASQNNNNKVLLFYFDYKQQSEQTPLMVLQTLLGQLLSTFARLPSAALDLQRNMALGKGLPSWKDLKRVFLDLCNSSGRVYIVFDALDECDKNTNRGQILEFLKELMESPVRTLITSRPYPPDVHKLLSGCSQVLVEASDADVRSYVIEHIGQSDLLAANVIDDELREKITSSIVAKSEGMYVSCHVRTHLLATFCGSDEHRLLLPALQIENILSQTNKTEVCDALETLPTTLADSLDLTLERIKLQSKHSKTRAKLALSVLMWLSTVRRVLTVQELQHAIATKPGLSHLDNLTDPRFFVDCCFGLVVVDQKTSIVRLVHFSINEHLQSRKSELFPEADAALAATCLKYLLLTSTSGSALEVDSVDIQAVCQKWRLIRYAADQWGFHAASRFDADVHEKVVQFCSSRSATKLWILCLEEKLAQLGPYEEESWQCVMKQVKPGFSLLHIAAVYGIDKLAEECIKDDSYDVNQTDSQGVTPLMIVAGTGNNRVVEMLLSANRNTSVNATDLNGKTALGHAAKEGQTEVVKTLLNSPAQIDINIGGPLVHACCTKWWVKTEVVDLLLDRPDLDPNPNPLDYDYEPWFGMARSWEPALLAKLLAKPSFDPWRWRSPTKQMDDFWKRVAETDNDPDCSISGLSGVPGFAIVRMLELDERFRFSGLSALQLLWPPLYFANTNHTSDSTEEVDWMTIWTFGWRPTLREFLSANNISLTFVDSKRRGFVHYLALMGFEDYLRFSIRQGLPVNGADCVGKTPLHLAAAKGQLGTVRILLEAGAQPTLSCKCGRTALHYAAESGSLPVTKLLLEMGADYNVRDHLGNTVLHMAATADVVDLLLQLGLPIDAMNTIGRTALMEAVNSGCEDLCRVLLDYGANPNTGEWTCLSEALCSFDKGMINLLLGYTDINPLQLDMYGRSVYDFLSQYPSTTAENLGIAGPIQPTTYTPTLPVVRRRRIVHFLRERLDIMISCSYAIKKDHCYRAGFQLLLLGDDASACTMFEMKADSRSKSGTPFFPNLSCGNCFMDEGPLFKCRTCPLVDLCIKCREYRKPGEDKVPHCRGHQYLQYPSPGWSRLPKGIVNSQGQTLDEFLLALKEKYSAEI